MFSVKRWLMSLLLVAAISSPLVAATPSEPNSVPSPVIVKQDSEKIEEKKYETFQDHWNLFDREVSKEVKRRHDRLKNLNEWNIMEDFISRRTYDPTFNMSREDTEIMEDYVWDVFEDAGKEFIDNHPDIDKFENEVRSAFSYEVFGMAGEKKKEDIYSPELAEEERKEEQRQAEVTAVPARLSRYFGEGYEIHSGMKPYIKSMEPGFKVYTRIENFSLFGVPFRKAKVEVNTHQQAKFYITKHLDGDWALGLHAKEDLLKGEEHIGVSLGRDFRNPRARISFEAGVRDGSDTYMGARYIARF